MGVTYILLPPPKKLLDPTYGSGNFIGIAHFYILKFIAFNAEKIRKNKTNKLCRFIEPLFSF